MDDASHPAPRRGEHDDGAPQSQEDVVRNARRRRWLRGGWLAIGTVIVVLGHVPTFLDARGLAVHPEESFNAFQALALGWTTLGNLSDLRYQTFCVGCDVDGVVGHLLFEVAGPTARAWRGVSLVWLLGLWFGAGLALARRYGDAALMAFAVLLTGSSGVLAYALSHSFGNHAEGNILAVVGLLWLLEARTRLGRAAAGIALFAGPLLSLSAVWAASAGVVSLALDRRGRALAELLAVAVVGAALVIVAWGTGAGTMFGLFDYLAVRPEAAASLFGRVDGLLDPAQLAAIHLGPRAGPVPVGVPLAVLAAVSLRADATRWWPVWASVVAMYALAPVRLPEATPDAAAYPLRWATAWTMATSVACAAAVGWWAPRRHGWVGVLLLATLAVPGAQARVHRVLSASPSAGPFPANLVEARLRILPNERHHEPWSCDEDPVCRALSDHRRGLSGHAGGPGADVSLDEVAGAALGRLREMGFSRPPSAPPVARCVLVRRALEEVPTRHRPAVAWWLVQHAFALDVPAEPDCPPRLDDMVALQRVLSGQDASLATPPNVARVGEAFVQAWAAEHGRRRGLEFGAPPAGVVPHLSASLRSTWMRSAQEATDTPHALLTPTLEGHLRQMWDGPRP